MSMESKLPKPSGLKRPGATIVPMNRIKREPTNLLMQKQMTLKPMSLTEPYKDLTNVPDVRGRRRAVSPDPKSNCTLRSKLRRSRSACDITTLKRIDNFPVKLERLNEVTTTRLDNMADKIKPPVTAMRNKLQPKTTSNVSTSSIIAKRKPQATVAQSTAAKPSIKKEPTKTGGNAISASTTGAAKPINKRIPPYDFKARYHDLLEKHKILKEKYQASAEQLENFENLPEQLESIKDELEQTKNNLADKVKQNASLEKETTNLNMQLESVSANFAKTKEALEALTENFETLKSAHEKLLHESREFKEQNERLVAENLHLNDQVQVCQEQLFRSNVERKNLHNDLMDLRGNIRVFCRVRPPLPMEADKPICGWNYLDEATLEIVNYDLVNRGKQGQHTFSFDYVFHPGSLQDDVFENVAPLIQSAMDGYNICIFAYGQTGSGKTYTMDGIPSNLGVIPRTVDLLFTAVKNYKNLGWQYTIKANFLEIYNEVLYDLLSNEQKDMEIRMATSNKDDIYVSNITEEIVETAEELRHLMSIAKMNRATASTAGNERSSRSHAVTKIQLTGYHEAKNEYSIGTINLVDLAGSESPKTSQRMTETKSINRSLSELTNVILALLQKQDHIPYRNSKLTHLLMPSLGGNSKTLMFINVAPFVDCYVESVKSLRFAASVNQCKVAKARRNRVCAPNSM